MKDSLIAILVVVGSLGIYFNTRTVSSVPPAHVDSKTSAKKLITQTTPSSKGVLNGKTTNQQSPQQDSQHEQGEGIGTDVVEVESLPSIYEKEGRPGFAAPVKAPARKKKSKLAAREQHAVVHGVPVQAFIDSKRNTLAMGGMPPKDPAMLRVFVQCMEVKGNDLENVSEKHCGEIAARGNSNTKNLLDRGASQTF